MADYQVNARLDITSLICPLTLAKTLVALESLEDGQLLFLRLNDGEPVQNIPRSLKEEGHQILKLSGNDDGTCSLIVRKLGGR